MKIAIVIATYRRDNKLAYYLGRALNSIRSQTHRDYEIFLIGDSYDDNEEFEKIAEKFGVYFYENLQEPVERMKYSDDRFRLWCCGGVNARNYGIDTALSCGFSFVSNMDHDDRWKPQHLEYINEVIEEHNPVFRHDGSARPCWI